MNTTIPFPARYLALMGVALAVAGLLLVARPVLLGDGGETVGSAPSPAAPKPTPEPTRPSQPKIVLLPGLPAKVANQLRRSKVVVVSLYQGSTAADRSAVGAARAGARAVGAGFLPVNVLNERNARAVQTFVGTTSTPTVVVVRRPGKAVSRLEGAASTDSALVAQAAHNAGAGKPGAGKR